VTSAESLDATDFRRTLPRFQGEALARNLSLVETLKGLAAQKGATPAQLALAWLLHQAPDIVPIPGTTKQSRLKENAAATDIALTGEDLAAIAAAVPETEIAGKRYDERGLAMVGRQGEREHSRAQAMLNATSRPSPRAMSFKLGYTKRAFDLLSNIDQSPDITGGLCYGY